MFINSINKSSIFKNKENYVDLQKTLHNIKEDIYSFNGLANIIIDLDNMKKNYVVGSENENKGLYEIYEIVQVYAANELLKNSYNHVEKFQDIQESKSVLEKVENTQEQENKNDLIAWLLFLFYDNKIKKVKKMYFNYATYYKNENEEDLETYTDKELKKELIKKNKDFYKTNTYKRFFL